MGSGQIPELLYRLPELESEEGEELRLLGREFSSTVSPVRKEGGKRERERREGERMAALMCANVPTDWSEGSAAAAAVGVAEPVSWRSLPALPEPVLHSQGLPGPAQDLHQVLNSDRA